MNNGPPPGWRTSNTPPTIIKNELKLTAEDFKAKITTTVVYSEKIVMTPEMIIEDQKA